MSRYMRHMHFKTSIEQPACRFETQQSTTNNYRFACMRGVFNHLLTIVHRAKDKNAIF